MSPIAWIVFGLIAGLIGNKLVRGSGQGVVADVIVGIVGAYVGGHVFGMFGVAGITGFNLWSLLVAVVGSSLFLMVLFVLQRRI